MTTCRVVSSIAAALAALFSAVFAAPGHADGWPSRPLTLVAPFAAGGSTDAIARIIADGLSKQLHRSVVVENVGGGGGMTGANRVAKAAPDGYQFVLGNVGTHAQNQTLYKHPLYHAMTDFAPVGLALDQSLALVARKDFPAKNLQEFIAYARAHTATIKYSSSGAGGSNHLACVLFNSAAGIGDVTHVPYRGAGQALQDLVAGLVDYTCPSLPAVIPHIKSQTLKGLAILSKKRSPSVPELPTAEEQGLTDFDIPTWYALFLPKGTPPPIVRKLNAAMSAALDNPDVRQRLERIGSDIASPERRTPEYLAKFVAAEIKKWEGPIKASGIQF
jgi:tripartite-type tricarboxylate transporter receptor subunit TctC